MNSLPRRVLSSGLSRNTYKLSVIYALGVGMNPVS
jgi:hypothetical protein